jgi:hypothetical protein
MIPVQYVLVGFRDAQISPKLKNRLLGLKTLHDAGAITVINLVAVRKDADGTVTAGKYSDLSQDERETLGIVAGALIGYGAAGKEGAQAGAQAVADRQDAGVFRAKRAEIAASIIDAMPNGSSAVLLVVAHNWVDRFGEGVAESGGAILATGIIRAEDLVALGEALGIAADEMEAKEQD